MNFDCIKNMLLIFEVTIGDQNYFVKRVDFIMSLIILKRRKKKKTKKRTSRYLCGWHIHVSY